MNESIKNAANALHSLAFDETLEAEITAAVHILAAQGPNGRIVVTGMGKAGHIARKFAATLASTAAPAHYVHPGESAHGDLGQIHVADTLIAISTSGRTLEVLRMLEQVAQLQCCAVIGITSHPEHMRDHCHHVVAMPVCVESDRYNLVPTVSTSVMLAICDQIAMDLMEANNVTRTNFADRHHGGYLGQKSRM